MATFGKYFLIVWTILFFNFFMETQAPPSCDHGWTRTPNGEACVKMYIRPPKAWHSARRACRDEGGDLVTIFDETKSNFVRDILAVNNTTTAWIGFHVILTEERWHWLDEDGTPNYTNWRYGYPDEDFWDPMVRAEECAIAAWVNGLGAPWINYVCFVTYPYICEKPLPSKCQWNDTVCLNIHETYDGWKCLKGRDGVARIVWPETYPPGSSGPIISGYALPILRSEKRRRDLQ
ncbi:secretory phospholipase a2 receptor [Plakobranchus ocellatus]|uniref:Secretory phospholipase a2 receptor n=1 Tax=Plakobranchus ocellatus TaxID=259542 RepID=A0AAV3ZSE6_9GAST|nr:secretory phospholipase a2 receptor [Plakobranchus ocellatus]